MKPPSIFLVRDRLDLIDLVPIRARLKTVRAFIASDRSTGTVTTPWSPLSEFDVTWASVGTDRRAPVQLTHSEKMILLKCPESFSRMPALFYEERRLVDPERLHDPKLVSRRAALRLIASWEAVLKMPSQCDYLSEDGPVDDYATAAAERVAAVLSVLPSKYPTQVVAFTPASPYGPARVTGIDGKDILTADQVAAILYGFPWAVSLSIDEGAQFSYRLGAATFTKPTQLPELDSVTTLRILSSIPQWVTARCNKNRRPPQAR